LNGCVAYHIVWLNFIKREFPQRFQGAARDD
jgi:hypothetical protein